MVSGEKKEMDAWSIVFRSSLTPAVAVHSVRQSPCRDRTINWHSRCVERATRQPLKFTSGLIYPFPAPGGEPDDVLEVFLEIDGKYVGRSVERLSRWKDAVSRGCFVVRC